MANTQRRRITVNSALLTGASSITRTTMTFDETDSVNFHGARFCFSLEPEDNNANANGFWVAYCLPSQVIANADLPSTFAELASQEYGAYVWGIGCWTASNQAPYHLELAPKTSRTCQRDARVQLAVFQNGISAGNSRCNMVITGFTS